VPSFILKHVLEGDLFLLDIEVYYLNMAHLFMLNIGSNLEYFNYMSSLVMNNS
jgi:hypothetical protein